MTSRLILTLLALLTGLSTQGATVEARSFAVQKAEIGAMVTVAEVRQATLAASLPVQIAERNFALARAPEAPVFREDYSTSPRVLTRIDRARE